MKKVLRTRVGRLQREVTRHVSAARAGPDKLARVAPSPRTRQAVCLARPKVECISKGKARTSYEFGVTVSIATTLKEGLVVDMRSMSGNPYDGHILADTLEQVGILTG